MILKEKNILDTLHNFYFLLGWSNWESSFRTFSLVQLFVILFYCQFDIPLVMFVCSWGTCINASTVIWVIMCFWTARIIPRFSFGLYVCTMYASCALHIMRYWIGYDWSPNHCWHLSFILFSETRWLYDIKMGSQLHLISPKWVKVDNKVTHWLCFRLSVVLAWWVEFSYHC